MCVVRYMCALVWTFQRKSNLSTDCPRKYPRISRSVHRSHFSDDSLAETLNLDLGKTRANVRDFVGQNSQRSVRLARIIFTQNVKWNPFSEIARTAHTHTAYAIRSRCWNGRQAFCVCRQQNAAIESVIILCSGFANALIAESMCWSVTTVVLIRNRLHCHTHTLSHPFIPSGRVSSFEIVYWHWIRWAGVGLGSLSLYYYCWNRNRIGNPLSLQWSHSVQFFRILTLSVNSVYHSTHCTHSAEGANPMNSTRCEWKRCREWA